MPGLDRRSLMERALMLCGAALAPGFSIEALAATATSKPALDAKRFALLSAVADTIVPADTTPGALAVGVPKLFDALLRDWAAPSRRADIVAALDRIETLAQDRQKRPFAALSAAQRLVLLTPHDAAALTPAPPSRPSPPAIAVQGTSTTVDPNFAKPKQEPVQDNPLLQGPRYVDPGYGKLKELIVVLFYISETALTHDLAYEQTPGEWLPSIPITPATRPWGGAGLV